ncbi:MAG: ATP-binding protein [Bacteroidales bacterium]
MSILQRHLKFEVKIFLIYLFVGGLWILFSDAIVNGLFNDPGKITRIQTYKGWFYVLITGILFYLFLRRHLVKLRTAEHLARESDRLKTTFLQNMSHEIRTPMNGIIGLTELLKSGELSDAEKVEYIRIISESSTLLFNIVNEVLDISMIESGTNKVSPHDISLNDLIDDIHHHFSHSVKAGVVIEISKGLKKGEDMICTDGVKVKQVLFNLISNSVKFVEKGYIRFGYELKGNTIEFHVEDTGIGIPKEVHQHIFDRFFKDNSPNDRFYEGVGLGLTICKGLVELLGGRIWLESEQGKGSRFYFTIPYVKVEDAAFTGTPARSRPVSTFSGMNILVAEDDSLNQRYIKEILSRRGINVLMANDGKTAVDICCSNKEIEIVLMDIKMPVMNGYEAATEIRKVRDDVRIIAQTAYTFDEEKKAIRAGFDAYISKPFREDQLLELIRKFKK